MLVGSAGPDTWAAHAPEVSGPPSEPLDLGRVTWLQAGFEQSGGGGPELFPPGLHPTGPVLVTVQAWRWATGAVAMVRASCRAGVRLRALVTRSVVAGDGDRLASWGLDGGRAGIDLGVGYDRSRLTVDADGPVLDVTVQQPAPLRPDDQQHVAAMVPVSTSGGLRLWQVEPDITNVLVERGRPRLDRFEAGFWGESLAPRWPVAGVRAEVDLTLPPVRFAQRPEELAFTGTERL